MQLTVEALQNLVKSLPKNMLVYISDDDELNGVHRAWAAAVIDTTQSDDDIDFYFSKIKPEKDQNQAVLLIS